MDIKPNKNIAGIEISQEAIAKMVSTSVLDVEGVAGVVARPVDIKGVFRDKASQAVHVKTGDNDIGVDIYLKLKMGAKIVSVCEAVQENVKTTLQNMTGKAVSKVNVNIVDIELPGAE